jgi:hypothetical protein
VSSPSPDALGRQHRLHVLCFPLFPFSSYLFSSPLSLAVWVTIVPPGWRWNGWRRLRLWLMVLIAEHGYGWAVNGGEA